MADSSKLESGLRGAESETKSWVNRLGGVIQGGLTFATGTLITDGIKNIGSSIFGLGAQAVEAYAKNEMLGLSLEAMLAKELKNASGIEKTIVVGQQKVELTKKERDELDKLTGSIDDEIFKRDQLSQKLQIAQAELAKMEGAEKRNETAIANKKLAIENLQRSYDNINEKVSEHQNRITELTTKQGQYVDVTKTVKEGQLTLADALKQVTGPAKTLQYWIEKLAIQSPFESEGISNAYQLALNFGFATNYAKGYAIGLDGVKKAQEENVMTSDRLITSLVDWGAATGKTTFEIESSTQALGQMRMTGKVTKEDLNQLTNTGIDWMTVLKGMGYDLNDVTKGVVKADDFILELTKSLESDFTGAAAKSGSSVTGLLTSLTELKTIGLREFFTGSIQAIQPYIASFIDILSGPETLASIRAVGDVVGNWLGGKLAGLASFVKGTALPVLKELFTAFQSGGLFGSRSGSFGGQGLLAALGISPTIIGAAQNIFSTVASLIVNLANLGGQVYQVFSSFVGGNILSGIAQLADLTGLSIPQVAGLVAWIINLRDGLMELGERVLNEVIPAFIAFVGPIIEQVMPGLQLLGQIMMNVAVAVLPLLIQWWNFLIDNINIILPVLAVVGAAILALTAPITLVIGAIVLLATAWANNWGGIQEKAQAVIDFIMPYVQQGMAFIQSIITSVLAYIQNWWKQHGDAVMVIINALWVFLKWLFDSSMKTIQITIETVAALIQAFWDSWGATLIQLAQLAWDNIKTIVQAAMDMLGFIIEAAAALIKGDWEAFGEALRSIWDTAWKAIKTIIDNAISGIKTVVSNLVNQVESLWNGFGSTLQSKWSQVWDAIKGTVSGAINPIKGWIDDIIGWTERAIKKLKEMIGLQDDAGEGEGGTTGASSLGTLGGFSSSGGTVVNNFTLNQTVYGNPNAVQDFAMLQAMPVT